MTAREPGISVIVCTYQGATRLPETLATLFASAQAASGFCEILVVDNASTDDTTSVIAEAARQSPVPFTMLHESQIGLSHARNCGLAHARCRVIAFTDDDVSVRSDWLSMLEQVFADPIVAAAGGKILPEQESSLPAWLTPDLYHHFALLDYGDHPQRMSSAAIWGANMAFRAECFDQHGRFDPELGRRGDRLYGGEETKFLEHLLKAGELVVYDPRLSVRHRLPPERLSKAWLLRRMVHLGEFEHRRANGTGNRLFGVPAWVLKDGLRNGVALLNATDRNAALRLRLWLNFCSGFAAAAVRARRRGHAGARS